MHGSLYVYVFNFFLKLDLYYFSGSNYPFSNMVKDIHKEPFDDGTKEKLFIFRDYLKDWLPVFLVKKDLIWNTINIYDFFAGPGSDIKGVEGTPLIILHELRAYNDIIVSKKIKVNLYFNEFDNSKYQSLHEKLSSDKVQKLPYNITVTNLDFPIAFEQQYPSMNRNDCANLLFLDQNGIRHIGEDLFSQIINLKTTDFLFFISSSTIKRFCEHPSISKHIQLDKDQVQKTSYHQIHRLVTEYYRSLLPKDKRYYIAPFSLKKGSGLYGIIFGTGHVLGIEKFLNTCWKLDKERGEANFDIDEDKITPGQLDIFSGEVRRPKKVDLFEAELTERILNRTITTDRELYLYSINNSFIPKHTNKVIRHLVSQNKILKSPLNISSKVCKRGAEEHKIKLK